MVFLPIWTQNLIHFLGPCVRLINCKYLFLWTNKSLSLSTTAFVPAQVVLSLYVYVAVFMCVIVCVVIIRHVKNVEYMKESWCRSFCLSVRLSTTFFVKAFSTAAFHIFLIFYQRLKIGTILYSLSWDLILESTKIYFNFLLGVFFMLEWPNSLILDCRDRFLLFTTW